MYYNYHFCIKYLSMREYRELNDEVKIKISRSMTGGKKSESTKQKISDSMKRYWANVPSKGGNHEEG